MFINIQCLKFKYTDLQPQKSKSAQKVIYLFIFKPTHLVGLTVNQKPRRHNHKCPLLIGGHQQGILNIKLIKPMAAIDMRHLTSS